jgi:hypothetical protein
MPCALPDEAGIQGHAEQGCSRYPDVIQLSRTSALERQVRKRRAASGHRRRGEASVSAAAEAAAKTKEEKALVRELHVQMEEASASWGRSPRSWKRCAKLRTATYQQRVATPRRDLELQGCHATAARRAVQHPAETIRGGAARNLERGRRAVPIFEPAVAAGTPVSTARLLAGLGLARLAVGR